VAVKAIDAEVAVPFPKCELRLDLRSGDRGSMLGKARPRRCRRSEHIPRTCLQQSRSGGPRLMFHLFSKEPVVLFVHGSILVLVLVLVLSFRTSHHALFPVLVPHGRVEEMFVV
jgi:hypothetical protein